MRNFNNIHPSAEILTMRRLKLELELQSYQSSNISSIKLDLIISIAPNYHELINYTQHPNFHLSPNCIYRIPCWGFVCCKLKPRSLGSRENPRKKSTRHSHLGQEKAPKLQQGKKKDHSDSCAASSRNKERPRKDEERRSEEQEARITASGTVCFGRDHDGASNFGAGAET